MTAALEKAKALYEAESIRRDREACKSFYAFFTKAWSIIDPAKFVPNWHHGLVCDHLEAVARGEIKDLAICQPPGTTKSKLVSVLWQPWIWTYQPTFKLLSASYEQRLAARDASASKALVRNRWYEQRWGTTLRDRGSDSLYFTLAGGLRFAAGTGTYVTGWHFDAISIDDPNNPMDVNIENFEKTIEWKRATLSSRRVDPATFRTVLIMQRLHDLDLAGYFIEKEGAKALVLPMRKSYSIAASTPLGEDPRAEGELLWPERFPEEVVKRMEDVQMGPNVASAQLQQDPVPAGGNIFTVEDCSHEYDSLPPTNQSLYIISGDLSFKDKTSSDFVSLQVWCSNWPRLYLVHRIHARMGFVDTLAAIRSLVAMFPQCTTILIEDKANGPAVIDSLKSEIAGIVPIDPMILGADKVARANACQGLFRSGSVLVPKHTWVADWRKEMTRFPKAPNDDDVDATTQALIWLKQNVGLIATKGKWGLLS